MRISLVLLINDIACSFLSDYEESGYTLGIILDFVRLGEKNRQRAVL